MNFSREQLLAIEAEGADVLVSASAGSGKTTVMIERILRLIEKGAQLKNMMIATFTKAAAADMKEKLLVKLTERAAESEACRRALRQLPQAQISTLHSFCQRLARTYFYAADIDPAFELLPDGDLTLFTRCLDETVEGGEGEDFRRLYDIMLTRRKDTRFKAAVRKIYEFAVALPHPEEWLSGCLNGYDDQREALAVIRDSRLEQRERLLVECRKLLAGVQRAGFDRNRQMVESIERALTAGDLSLILPPPRSRIAPGHFELAERCRKMKGAAEEFLSSADYASRLRPSADAKWCAVVLRDLAAALLKSYSSRKREAGLADYNDLEHFAYDILRSPYAESIRESIEYVFVDEYQDINPLQDAIIGLLKRPGNLFMVGDLKQSIYAFRGCDPSIFAAKREAFAAGEGIAVELNANFRSAPEIIEQVNRAFDECMRADFGGVDYASSARLIPSKERGEGQFRCVGLTVGGEKLPVQDGVYSVARHTPSEEIKGDEAESEFIVGEIVRLLGSPRPDGQYVSPSDIAVLTRSRSALPYLVRDGLKAAGIEAFVREKTDYDDNSATAGLIALLRLTDNPLDDVSLCAAALSHYGGLTENDLAAAAAAIEGEEPFCTAVRTAPAFAPLLKRLDHYRELSQSLPAGELAALIAAEADAEKQALKRGGRQCAEELTRFLRLACSRGAENVSGFLKYLDQREDADRPAPDGCVTVMSVHNSKGLEFDYVFLAGVHRHFNRSDLSAPLMLHRRLGLAVKCPDDNERRMVSTPLTEAVRLTLDKSSLEEEMRVMYVAMTRARRGLFVTGCNLKAGERPPGARPLCPAHFLQALSFETEHPEKRGQCFQPPGYVPVFTGGDEKLASLLRAYMEFVYPYPPAAAKTTVTASARAAYEEEEFPYAADNRDYLPPSAEGAAEAGREEESDATERGSACHAFMQRVDFSADFAAEAERFAARFPAQAALLDLEKLSRAVEDMRWLCGGRRIYKEKEFIMDEGGTLVQGVIDLLAVGEKDALIVDYKTGRRPDKPQYRAQINLYRRAVRRLLGLTVSGAYIYALDGSALIEIEPR